MAGGVTAHPCRPDEGIGSGRAETSRSAFQTADGVTLVRVSFWEIMVVLVVALVLFGPNRLPEMGRSLGKALREFRQATSDLGSELSRAQQDLTAAASTPAPKPEPAAPAAAGQPEADTPPEPPAGQPGTAESPEQATHPV